MASLLSHVAMLKLWSRATRLVKSAALVVSFAASPEPMIELRSSPAVYPLASARFAILKGSAAGADPRATIPKSIVAESRSLESENDALACARTVVETPWEKDALATDWLVLLTETVPE